MYKCLDGGRRGEEITDWSKEDTKESVSKAERGMNFCKSGT